MIKANINRKVGGKFNAWGGIVRVTPRICGCWIRYFAETDGQIFRNYNEDGTVRLTFTPKGERVVSYWQQPSDKHELRSTVCFKTGCEAHNLDGSPFRTVITLEDSDKRNPRRIELRDDTDQPQMGADYEYELDGHGNWTKRSVWVWTRGSERQLLEN